MHRQSNRHTSAVTVIQDLVQGQVGVVEVVVDHSNQIGALTGTCEAIVNLLRIGIDVEAINNHDPIGITSGRHSFIVGALPSIHYGPWSSLVNI